VTVSCRFRWFCPILRRAWRPAADQIPDRRVGNADPGISPVPGVDGVATYSEKLLVGYRWYQQRGVEPAFPFGHGLDYTSFKFADLRADVTEMLIRVTFSIRNVGSRRGKAVPQLYVTFPPETGEPPAQLEAFHVVRLEPGQVREVAMEIPIDDFALYGAVSQSRVVGAGMYEIQLGVSSVDRRLNSEVEIRPQGGSGARLR
jgi:beta-glucosidase